MALVLSYFNRFVLYYAPKFQIFNDPLEPNTCYSQSPLLFWTIVTIGSRKLVKDPTLLNLLGPKVVELTQSAIFSRTNSLSIIQAFLLLCIWPMPVITMYKDVSPIMAGAALNLALTVGLHIPGVGQDFSRTTVLHDSNESRFRARLWVSCLIAIQGWDILH
jgi:transcriptional regulatory protein LEU3